MIVDISVRWVGVVFVFTALAFGLGAKTVLEAVEHGVLPWKIKVALAVTMIVGLGIGFGLYISGAP